MQYGGLKVHLKEQQMHPAWGEILMFEWQLPACIRHNLKQKIFFFNMPHLTFNVILSLGTGFCVLQIPLQSPCPQANPSVTLALCCLDVLASQDECPSIQTITEKEDLRNQLAMAGEATEASSSFSFNTEEGISFVLN